MDWYIFLAILLLSLFILLLIRVPVAIAFLFVNIITAIFIWGGGPGLVHAVTSIEASLTTFTLVPIPLFILMGEIMFQCNLAPKMIETLEKWIGKLPGRLSIMTVAGGTLLSTLTGSSMGSTAILGSTMLPEMRERGYKDSMSIGPILASGVLATMIPPSAIAVLLASIGRISVGSFLIAIILPGILMAVLVVLYIVIRCTIQPDIAPGYEAENISLKEKIIQSVIYILPLGLIIFLVIGLIFLGVATPTESAAMGVLGSLLLAFFYKRLNLKTLKKAIYGSVKVSGQLLFVISGSLLFSEILSFSGATRNLIGLVDGLNLTPFVILIILLLLLIFLGLFMDGLSILMISLPIYMPIAEYLAFDPLWFGVLILISLEIGFISPPFGLGLFVMKSVSKETSMNKIYTASIPFIAIYMLVIAIIIAFPEITSFLPNLMRN